MSKYRGVMRKNDLEGGFWELHTGEGEHYQISGADAGLERDGLEVEVEGEVDKNAMGIGMTGPMLSVKSYKVV